MAPLSPSQGRLAPKLTPLPCLASGIAPVGILWDSCQGAESLTGFHESITPYPLWVGVIDNLDANKKGKKNILLI